jgi:hypothetical protein
VCVVRVCVCCEGVCVVLEVEFSQKQSLVIFVD